MASVKGMVSTFEKAGKPPAPVEIKRKEKHVVKETADKFQKYVDNVIEQREKKSPYQTLMYPAAIPPVFSLTDYRPPKDRVAGAPRMKMNRTGLPKVLG